MIKLNGYEIKPTIFPDKTSQVWQLPNHIYDCPNVITWEFENEAEFMHLAQLVYLLRSERLDADLFMPYLPYGRQDKKPSNESTFALYPFLELLLSLNFEYITTLDAHSDICTKYGIKSIKPEISDILVQNDLPFDTNILYPDFGALARYKSEDNKIMVEKDRDPLTGRLKIERVNLKYYDRTQPILMIDDICDGGGTFIMIAEELKKLGITEYMLYTTHGIYSKGLQPLIDAGFTKIINYKGVVYEKN